VTFGLAERQTDLLDDAKRFCNEAVPADSIYALLHRERDQLFPHANVSLHGQPPFAQLRLRERAALQLGWLPAEHVLHPAGQLRSTYVQLERLAPVAWPPIGSGVGFQRRTLDFPPSHPP